jgi:hypothetical protein
MLFVQVPEFPMLMSPGTYWALYVAIAISSVLQKERLLYQKRQKYSGFEKLPSKNMV